MNKKEWFAALKSFKQARCQYNTIPHRSSLSDEKEWHCRIIGGEFIGWYQHHLRGILAERLALRVRQFDPSPLIVFTTTIPGLIAAQEIMQEPPENLVYLLQSDFEKWEKQNLVDEFTFHIHHWSYFRPLNQDELTQASKMYSEVNPEELRIHASGDLWGELCGVGCEHLWRWNGQKMELLEEAFSQVRF